MFIFSPRSTVKSVKERQFLKVFHCYNHDKTLEKIAEFTRSYLNSMVSCQFCEHFVHNVTLYFRFQCHVANSAYRGKTYRNGCCAPLLCNVSYSEGKRAEE